MGDYLVASGSKGEICFRVGDALETTGSLALYIC